MSRCWRTHHQRWKSLFSVNFCNISPQPWSTAVSKMEMYRVLFFFFLIFKKKLQHLVKLQLPIGQKCLVISATNKYKTLKAIRTAGGLSMHYVDLDTYNLSAGITLVFNWAKI